MITPRQLEILQHSLGVDKHGQGKMYRNHFCAGGDDEGICRELVALGYMKQHRTTEWLPYFNCSVTEAGIEVVRQESPPPPKLNPFSEALPAVSEGGFRDELSRVAEVWICRIGGVEMRVKKWVCLEDEVEVEVDVRDISSALSEAFGRLDPGPMEEHACRHDVLRAFNNIGAFLNAVTPELIAMMTPGQRKTIETFLHNAAERFEPTCHHERLNEDGICQNCGADKRGIG